MLFELSIYQIVLGIVALFFLSDGITKFIKREKSQTLFKLAATIIIWGGIFIFSLLPQLTHTISKGLGLGENLNTLIFIGFMMIFIILFKIINIIERIERNISEIVRKEALSKLKDK